MHRPNIKLNPLDPGATIRYMRLSQAEREAMREGAQAEQWATWLIWAMAGTFAVLIYWL